MKNPVLNPALALLCMFISATVTAQHKEDVIYLTDGSIIHGILLKDTVANTIRILNHAGDTWVFDRSRVDSITREKLFEYKAILFNRQGLEFSVNAEFLMRSKSNAIGKASIPGINMEFGYRFNPYISFAAGMGAEFYEWLEIPFSAAIRARLSGRALSPLVFIKSGYTVPAEKRPDDFDYAYKSIGGYFVSVGVGIERVLNENASFLFSFSYHYQKLGYHLTPLHQWVQERDRTETYSRFRIAIGYIFK